MMNKRQLFVLLTALWATSIGAQKYQEFTNEVLGIKKDETHNSLSSNTIEEVTEPEVK